MIPPSIVSETTQPTIRRRVLRRRVLWSNKPGRWEVETPPTTDAPATPAVLDGLPPFDQGAPRGGTPEWNAYQLNLIRHLYRRAGFGITSAEAQRFVSRGGYVSAVEWLLDIQSPDPADTIAKPTITSRVTSDDHYDENVKLAQWWVQRMVTSTHPLREKLAFFWHDHFACQFYDNEPMMADNQLATIRRRSFGNFEPFLFDMAKDPMLIRWLSGDENRKGAPNVNFARELLELFTVGLGNYTELDVREAGRAFTGWHIATNEGPYFFRSSEHDFDAKTVLGLSGNLDGGDIVHLLANHAATRRFIPAKLWSYFAYQIRANDPVIDPLVAEFSKTGNIRDTLRVMFMHPEFVGAKARAGQLKNPLEFFVGIHKTLGLDLDTSDNSAYWTLRNLNMAPYFPPNVSGWEQNVFWATVAQVSDRLDISSWRSSSASKAWLNAVPLAQRAAVVADRLGLDGWSPASLTALNAVANSSESLLHLGLMSPEFAQN